MRGPRLDVPRGELLHELFERQADARPGQIALACDIVRMTYGELEQKANQLARHLRARGVRRGSFVALLLPRSMDVYVGLLAALKAGAAYVPLDPDYPADRVEYILGDCGMHSLITTSTLAEKRGAFNGVVIELDQQSREIAAESDARLTRTEIETTAEDLAYVIYTSGSTGRPKGVMIEHRAACNLVRAEGQIFRVTPEDRVFQGFSIAFDASVEEVWLAFFAGATLVVGTREMMQAGPGLPRMLTDAGVTVLSSVPTLFAMMDEDIPTARLLITGGEACPQHLLARWCRTGRRVVNTYGPTEATVIATWGDCDPQRPVTIGRPVANYLTYILDEQLRPVPAGEVGELHLGGVGLARGYVGRPDLTAEKFVANPFAAEDGSPKLYKTGDLARFNADGEIEFMGRADSQVKLRGFRIELSEIESVLLQCPGVRAAAVAMREDTPGLQQLVGYLVAANGAPFDEDSIKSQLRTRLPAYMVPALLENIATLPTLPSGKVDRKQLPPPRPRTAKAKSTESEPRTEVERKIHAVWSRLFAPAPVGLNDDFFLALGGHSLLAARMVSVLRQDAALQGISILDVYHHPTVESLAAKVGREEARRTSGPAGEERKVHRSSSLAHFLCGGAQFVGLYFVLGFFALQWLAPYLTYTWMVEEDYEHWQAIVGAFTVLVALYPAMLAAAVAIKWIVIGRYRAGEYPLWGVYYFRWWFVNTIQGAIPVAYLAGTPLLNIYYRLMGARIGANVHLGAENFSIFDLLDIGDDTSIGTDASVLGYTIEEGMLKIAPVKIGARCFVGTRSVVREGARLEDDAMLEDLSLLSAGETIPAGERWIGSPARFITKSAESFADTVGWSELAPHPIRRGEGARRAGERERGEWHEGSSPSTARRFFFGLAQAFGVLLFPSLVLLAIFPGMALMNHLNYEDDYYWYLKVAPLIALSFVVLLCAEIALIKWLVLGRVRPGRHPLYGGFHLRKWFVDRVMELSLDFLGPLYASIYLPPWYRLLGARLGKDAEISTASFISPDLLDIGAESFIADSVSFGAARVERGTLTIAGNRVGMRSFIGNSALLPPGAVIGDNCLIGCLSVPPTDPADAARAGTTWFGSPAVFLPQRQQSTAFSEENTFKPTMKLRGLRAAIELVRVIAPVSGFIVLTSLLFSVIVLLQEDLYLHEMLLLFPLLYAGAGLIAVAFVIAVKWLLVGRYQAGEKPLWNHFVWRNELVNALHEHLGNDFIINALTGTPFLAWYLRALGAKVGRRAYIETTDFTEFDLVHLGDDAVLNADCTIQTHLFEDRVMKMSRVEIGPGCRVGTLSLVLYDTRMEAGASLDDLSLLMKGETLPAGTRWQGIPARPAA